MAEKLSVCVIAKNEARNLARCLESVQWADEMVVVVDSSSTDDTAAVAKKLGAKAIVADWPGWAKQKNRASKEAAYDWILSLDADEWLPEGSEKIIRTALTGSADSFTLRRKTFFLGRWIAHMGWYPDEQVRLYRKSATSFAEVEVHEKVTPTSKTQPLNLDILHESYTSLEQYYAKTNVYSDAQAKQQIKLPGVWWKVFLKPPARFIQMYLLKAGFLDGWQGLVLAALSARYDFRTLNTILFLRRIGDQ